MTRVTLPSRPMRMKALGAKLAAAAAADGSVGNTTLSSSPPPAAALAARNVRRESLPGGMAREVQRSMNMAASLTVGAGGLRRLLDGVANPHIGAAATDVAGHGVVDVGVGRLRLVDQERRRRHDLAGLAVAALHDLEIEPCLLDLAAFRRLADRLDRRDRGGPDAVDRRDAGARGGAVDMHGAGT